MNGNIHEVTKAFCPAKYNQNALYTQALLFPKTGKIKKENQHHRLIKEYQIMKKFNLL